MESVPTVETVTNPILPKSVLIADDGEFWRINIKEQLEKLFPSIKRYTLVGTAAEALARATIEKPDLIFLDIQFRNETEHGIQIAGKIWQAHPTASIIIVSTFDKEAYVKSLHQVRPKCAAYGYVLKDDILTYLRPAVEAIARGVRFIDPQVRQVAQRLENPDYDLAADEFETLVCVALGYTDGTIGQLLYLHPGSVRARLRKVYAKFGIPDKLSESAGVLNPRARATWLAWQRGLLTDVELQQWAQKFAELARNAGITLELC